MGKRSKAACKSMQCACIECVSRPLTIGRIGDKTSIDEDAQVLRNGGLREIEPLHDILAAAGRPLRQRPQDLQARGMG